MDALLNKLEQKGILTVDEAKELKAENQQDSAADFNKALNSKFQMPDWVTSYKLYGDFRGRFDEYDHRQSRQSRRRTQRSGQHPPALPFARGFDGQYEGRFAGGFPAGLRRCDCGRQCDLSNNTPLQDNGTKKADLD